MSRLEMAIEDNRKPCSKKKSWYRIVPNELAAEQCGDIPIFYIHRTYK